MRNFLFFILIVFWSCGRNNTTSKTDSQIANEVKYAKGFSIINRGDYYEVEVYNPWNNYNLLARYSIVDSPKNTGNYQGDVIKAPIRKGVFLSSTYIGMLSMLNASEVIKACSAANWICDSLIYSKYREGKIVNLGNSLTLDAEAIIAQSPDVIMKYIYQAPDESDAILKSAGIPIVYNIEFMEEHPLGRAEWIKLMGLLTGKKKMADSLFATIVENYKSNCELAQTTKVNPSVLIGNSYKGTWYAVGGKSYMARLISDAGAEYYWKSDSSTGGIPLSFEAVLQKQKDADYWLNANAESLSEIVNIEPRCNKFSAFQNGKVYHYNKRKNPEGGLDYYESGVVRPDLLLKDLIIILHPELVTNNEQTVYWKKLN
jgi:iron complex transport system substrate-binding protein